MGSNCTLVRIKHGYTRSSKVCNGLNIIFIRFQVRSCTVKHDLNWIYLTFTGFTVPPACVRVMLKFTHWCMFDTNWLILWLGFINFQWRKSYIIVIQNNSQCNRWQNKGIKNYEKPDRHGDCVYPCLTVFDHVYFVLKLYWLYGYRLKTYVHTCELDFMYGCIYNLTHSFTVLYDCLYDYIRTRHPYQVF